MQRTRLSGTLDLSMQFILKLTKSGPQFYTCLFHSPSWLHVLRHMLHSFSLYSFALFLLPLLPFSFSINPFCLLEKIIKNTLSYTITLYWNSQLGEIHVRWHCSEAIRNLQYANLDWDHKYYNEKKRELLRELIYEQPNGSPRRVILFLFFLSVWSKNP